MQPPASIYFAARHNAIAEKLVQSGRDREFPGKIRQLAGIFHKDFNRTVDKINANKLIYL